MADFDTSLLENRTQVYDSFIQLTDGANRYRLKSLQSSEPVFSYPNIDRISDAGELFLTPEVSQNRYTQRIVLTTTEVDTASPPTDPKTISWYIYQKEQRNSVQAEISIVYTAKDAPSPNIMRLDFTYEIENFGTPRINEEGDVFFDVEGRILPGTVSFIRDTS